MVSIRALETASSFLRFVSASVCYRTRVRLPEVCNNGRRPTVPEHAGRKRDDLLTNRQKNGTWIGLRRIQICT